MAHFRCEKPAAGVARQWFRPDGILAWLPLPGDRMSIVWSARGALADELAALDAEAFARRVRDAGGAALGDLALDSPVARFPAAPDPRAAHRRARRRPHRGCRPRRASARGPGREPRASRTRAASPQTLAGRSPLERPGDLALLRRHERARRADVDAMQFVTDRLEWLFGLDAPMAGAARNAGLRAVDAAGWAKRAPGRPRNAIIPRPSPPGTSPAGRGPIPELQRPSMNLLASLSSALLVLALAFPALAQDLDRVKSDLRKKFPDAQIDTVRKSGYGGLIEVTGGGDVFYTDEKTTFLLLGSIVDTKTRENVTEARVRKLSAVKFDGPAARVGHQDRARQRLAQDRHLRGPELRLLQALPARCGRRDGHHDIRVPLPDPLAGLDGQGEGGVVLGGPAQGVARPDAQGCDARRRGDLRDADRQDRRLRAREAHHAARPRSSSRTASAFPARCPSRSSRSASRTRRRPRSSGRRRRRRPAILRTSTRPGTVAVGL